MRGGMTNGGTKEEKIWTEGGKVNDVGRTTESENTAGGKAQGRLQPG